MRMDHINALFELGGTLLMLPTLIRSWRLGTVQGVHLATPLFFWSWGLWNILYYPSLGQFWSFTAGILLFITNTAWIVMVWCLTPKEKTV